MPIDVDSNRVPVAPALTGEHDTFKGEIKNVTPVVTKTTSYFKGWLRRRRVQRGLTVLLLLACLFVWPAATWAHPLGNFTVNRYSRLELEAGQIHLYYIVDMAEIPAFQERAQLDADQDGQISPAEQEQYLSNQAAILQSNLHLRLNETPLTWARQAQQLEFPPGQGGLLTMRLTMRLAADLPDQPQPWQVDYRDDNYINRLGWQEIVVQAAAGVALLESSVPAEDISQELRRYPQDLLQSPLQRNTATFRFQPQTAGSAAIQNPNTEPPNLTSSNQNPKSEDSFATLITIPTLGPGALLLALVAAFGWGAAHALSPGHGKTVVAAYLVGSRGTVRHAIFLGLTTTLTHTAGVFALGGVTLFVSQFILPEQLFPWLGVASGMLVVAIGLSLFMGRLRSSHHHHDHSHLHSHDHDHPHDHSHAHDHHHSHAAPHGHSHMPPGGDGSPVTWRSLLALGISGGLLPCPSALVVMLSAIALQRIGFGLLLILTFSLGLASVLTAIGILFVHAGRLFERTPIRGRLVQLLPMASALFVVIAGLGITWQGLVQAGVLQL